MELFPRTFLLVFLQLSVGGFLCLSVPPFHAIDRGYYKSSAAIYLLLGMLGLLGRVALALRSSSTAAFDAGEIGLWSLFVTTSAGYLWTLWSDRYVLRARLFAANWLLGLAALVVSAQFYRASTSVTAAVLYPVSFVLSALLLGSTASGMLLGHWYLIDRDLSLEPLDRIHRLYVRCLLAQSLLVPLGGLFLWTLGGGESRSALALLAAEHRQLLSARLLLSPLAAAALAWMIRRTLDVPQTMAATGLFYIAVLTVVVAEFLGRYILFRTALPL
jgi:hypothetical protein